MCTPIRSLVSARVCFAAPIFALFVSLPPASAAVGVDEVAAPTAMTLLPRAATDVLEVCTDAEALDAVPESCGDYVCDAATGETCTNCPTDCNQPISCASESAQCGYISRCNQSTYCGACFEGQKCDNNQCVNCDLPVAHCWDSSMCPNNCWCGGDTCYSVSTWEECRWEFCQ
jgi:hypothetical protein